MLIKLAIKTGLAGGAIYYSRELGVWGTSKQTEQLYKKLTYKTQPYLKQAKDKLPFEVPPLPKTGEMRFLAKHYYNQGVKSSIHFVYMMPCYAGQLIKKAKDAVNSAIEAPPAAGSTAK